MKYLSESTSFRLRPLAALKPYEWIRASTREAPQQGNKELAAEVEADAQIANNEGFTETPSFLIGRSGGPTEKLGGGALEPSTFNSAIEKLLKT